jgi:hypothetical protein
VDSPKIAFSNNLKLLTLCLHILILFIENIAPVASVANITFNISILWSWCLFDNRQCQLMSPAALQTDEVGTIGQVGHQPDILLPCLPYLLLPFNNLTGN